MQLVIYKAIFGDYDRLPEKVPATLKDSATFVLITDKKVEIDGWKVITVSSDNPVLSNRHCKFFPWEYFDADLSMYLDGHLTFGPDFKKFLTEVCSYDKEFYAPLHRRAGKISDEVVRAIDNAKLSQSEIRCILESDLEYNDLAIECGLIIRSHSCPGLKNFASVWWDYFNSVCLRDQISVMTAARKANVTITFLPFNLKERSIVTVSLHKNAYLKMIFIRLKKAIRIFLKGSLIK